MSAIPSYQHDAAYYFLSKDLRLRSQTRTSSSPSLRARDSLQPGWFTLPRVPGRVPGGRSLVGMATTGGGRGFHGLTTPAVRERSLVIAVLALIRAEAPSSAICHVC